MKKIKVGIVGLGTISPIHLEAILNLNYVELVCVCDKDPIKAEGIGQREGCQWTSDYEEVLKNSSIEVIHILTPHYLHVPMAIEALEEDKHVILEKPVGISRDQLKSLEKSAKACARVLGVTFQNRVNPTTEAMLRLIHEGSLGQLQGATGVLNWFRADDYYHGSDWRGDLKTEGGGVLINQAIHTLDLLEYIGGPITSLKAQTMNNFHPTIEVEDTAMVALRYENGARGNLFASNCHGKNSEVELEFVFEHGTLRLLDKKLYLVGDAHQKFIISDEPTSGDKAYWGMSHQRIIGNIYEGIQGKDALRVTLADALRATDLVLASYESAKSGQWETVNTYGGQVK